MRKINPKEHPLLDFVMSIIPSFLKKHVLVKKVDNKWESETEMAFLSELKKAKDKAVIVLQCPQQHLESRMCICMECPSLGTCKLEKSIKSHGCLEKFLVGCQHKYQMENKNEEEGSPHSGGLGLRSNSTITIEGD